MENLISKLLNSKNIFNKKTVKRQVSFDVMFSNLKKLLLAKDLETFLYFNQTGNNEYLIYRTKKTFNTNNLQEANILIISKKTVDDSLHLCCYNTGCNQKNLNQAKPFFDGFLSADQFTFIIHLLKEYTTNLNKVKNVSSILISSLSDYLNYLLKLQQQEENLFKDVQEDEPTSAENIEN